MDRCKPVEASFDWGRWYQTKDEVHVNVYLPLGTTAKEVSVCIKEDELECKLNEGPGYLLKGPLFKSVNVEESTWTIEERRKLHIALGKKELSSCDTFWKGLFQNEFMLDPDTEEKVREYLVAEARYVPIDVGNPELLVK